MYGPRFQVKELLLFYEVVYYAKLSAVSSLLDDHFPYKTWCPSKAILFVEKCSLVLRSFPLDCLQVPSLAV